MVPARCTFQLSANFLTSDFFGFILFLNGDLYIAYIAFGVWSSRALSTNPPKGGPACARGLPAV
eukprot:11454413-Alexandrium_andersonii.AAC.1